MKHFLATRFNLRFDVWKTVKDGSVPLTEEWLAERFDLFQTYCLPSVVHQKNQDFYWVVFFDTDTPKKYKKLINEIATSFKNFYPLYINGYDSLLPSFKQFIQSHLEEQDDFIITSRLDNDDVLHEDFTDTVQRLAVKKHETVIDLRRGYKMDITNNFLEFRKYYFPFNQFVSLVESAEEFNTVFSRMHPDWKYSSSIIIYDIRPLWIETIHKKNMLNNVSTNANLIKNVNIREFGIKTELKEKSSVYITLYNLQLLLKNLIKKYVQ